MSGHRITPDSRTKTILGALVVWNLVDIVLHIAVDEVEVLRVSANLILIAIAAAILLGRGGAHPAHPLVPALAAFLVLNLIVMIDKGPAAPMILLIIGSVVLASAAIQRLRPPLAERRIKIGRR